MKTRKIHTDYFRSLIFGAEDSLVSTVGVLFGVSTALADKSTIILTGFVVIAVEALSMGAGAFLTEESAHELDDKRHHRDKPWIGGLIMFFSYFLTGFIPLAPYFFLDLYTAKVVSVTVTFVALFIVGYLPTKSSKSGFRMAVVAGLAIAVGYLIGKWAPSL